jgi:hypothetical protein
MPCGSDGFMYLPIEASYNGLRTIDVNKLKFRYSWMDIHFQQI